MKTDENFSLLECHSTWQIYARWTGQSMFGNLTAQYITCLHKQHGTRIKCDDYRQLRLTELWHHLRMRSAWLHYRSFTRHTHWQRHQGRTYISLTEV